MTTAPKRRWFAFSLRTLFVGVAVFGIWLGWEFNFVQQRNAMRDWIADHGGSVDVFRRPDISGSLAIIQYERVLGSEEEPSIPQWRRWLGDEAINQIMMPSESTDADLARARFLFPEGDVKRIESRPRRGLLRPPGLSPPAETSFAVLSSTSAVAANGRGRTNSGSEARGGGFDDDANPLTKYYGFRFDSAGTFADVGFRLAMVPEPRSAAQAAFGFAGLIAWGWQRKLA